MPAPPVRVAAALTTLLLAAAIGGCTGAPDPAPTTPLRPTPAPSWVPPAGPPPAAAEPGPGVATLADAAWLDEVSDAVGIPRRALAAYAGVALWKAAERPDCRLSWNLLAGIGFAESDHGRHDGSQIGDDGVTAPPVFGVSLSGDGTEHIPDSDAGAIDGDVEYDRAVGPMQLIPQTWRNWHVDANGDGVEDPQQIDDAVMATANYLCRSATALDTETGWQGAVAAYNPAPSYRDRVARAAQFYLGGR